MKKILLTLLIAIGISTVSFGQKTWDGGGGNSNWGTANNWNPNGVPTSTDAVTIGNGINVTVNVNAVCASLTISGGNSDNTLTISSGQSLTVSGTVTINAGTGTGGGGDDKILAVGAGTLTCASIVIASTTDDAIDSEITISTGTVNVSGDISMNGTAARNAIRFSGAGTLNVGGDVAPGGDIVPSAANGLVNYNGTSGDQTVKADTYADITFSGGATKTVASGGIIITDVATFTNGIVTSTSANLITFNNGSSVAGASDASFVSGPVAKTGTTAFTFPVGNTTGNNPNRYHPVSIGATGASNTFVGQYYRANPNSGVGGSWDLGIYGISICEYWSLLRSSGTSTADVTIEWNQYSPCNGNNYITTTLGLFLAWYDAADTRWEQSLGTGTSNTHAGDYSSGTLTRTSVTFSASPTVNYFTFGNAAENGSPLPVKLGPLTAFEKNNGVQIDWTAYSEENLNKYVVERSADGRQYLPIGEVNARNITSESKYGFFDANPLAGISFYRLRNVDIDGKTGLSNIVRVNLSKTGTDLRLYPNPTSNGTISYQSTNLPKGNYSVRIFNAAGQQVYTQRMAHQGGAVTQTLQLPSGIQAGLYNLRMESESTIIGTKTFMLQ